MTQAELNFYENVPRQLRAIAEELKKLNEGIKKVIEKLDELAE